ncbi:MAG: hypothetical protein ACLPWF_07675 [Bryobacteraceae bacterium]
MAEAAILSERWLSATTLADVLARPAVITAAGEQPSPVLRRVVIRKQGPALFVEVYANRPMSPTFLKSVEAVADLLSLPPGWNSYSAKPIDHENARQAIRLLAEFLKPSMLPPSVVPTVRGGIQLEWHTRGVNVETYIESPNAVSFFAEEAGTGKSSDVPLSGHEHELSSWLERLSGK